jgi:hypothetical protein
MAESSSFVKLEKVNKFLNTGWMAERIKWETGSMSHEFTSE